MKPSPFQLFRASGLAALALCASPAYGAGGSRTWTGAADGDFYNGANWTPSGDFPNGNATFSGTVANSTITRTSNTYDYVFGLIFANTSGIQSSFTFSPGGTKFFLGGPSISSAAVTSGSLTDEIGVELFLVGGAKAFDINSNHDLKISGNVTSYDIVSVTKNGAGTLILSGTNNSYAAPTTITAGTLSLTGSLTGGGAISTSGSGVFSQSSTGVISGASSFTQGGASTSVLSGTNTYTGTTTITAGTLLTTKAAALSGYNSAGKVIFNGGTLGVQVGGSGWTSIEVDALLTNATKTSGTLGIDTTNGNWTQGTAFTTAGFGGLGLTKLGTNALTLNQANTYTGVTTVSVGTLKISNNAALGATTGNTIVNNTGILELGGGVTTAEPITIATGQTGAITATWGTNNTLTGAVTLTSNADFRLGPGMTTFSGGITSANNSNLGVNGRAIINTAPITIGTGQLGFTSNSPFTATEINVTGNTWGKTLFNFGGYLKLGTANALPSTTDVEFGWTVQSFSSGTLDLNGFDQTVASIGINSNSVGLGGDQNITGGGTLTVNLISGTKTYEGRITDGTTATALIKNGDGTQILKNLSGTASNYSGGTAINGGTLLVNNTSGSGTGTGTVTVAAGGTLGGSGSVIGGVNVSGMLAPGNSIESLGTGALSFAAGSTYAYELSTLGLDGDLTYSSGTLDIASGTILTLTDLFTSTALANGSKLTLISSAGAWNGGLFTYGGSPLADDSNITLGANIWKFNYNDTVAGSNFTGDITGATNFVTMTVVPEPNVATLLGGIGTLLLLRRRRSGTESWKRSVSSSQ